MARVGAMTHIEAVKRRRLLVGWVVTVVTCGGTVLLDLLLQPLNGRVVGLAVSSGLTGTAYVTATAMCFPTFRWLRAGRQAMRRITVRGSRQGAGLPGVR